MKPTIVGRENFTNDHTYSFRDRVIIAGATAVGAVIIAGDFIYRHMPKAQYPEPLEHSNVNADPFSQRENVQHVTPFVSQAAKSGVSRIIRGVRAEADMFIRTFKD